MREFDDKKKNTSVIFSLSSGTIAQYANAKKPFQSVRLLGIHQKYHVDHIKMYQNLTLNTTTALVHDIECTK